MTSLRSYQGDPVFDSHPVATLLLDVDFTIRAVNPGYVQAVGRPAEELLGRFMFDAFPDNPGDPEADGVANLTQSLETAARLRRPHHMLVQRHDIVDRTTGDWLERVWHPVNSPVLVEDRVVGFLHQVHDLTPLAAEQVRVLKGYRDMLLDAVTPGSTAERLAEHADAVAAMVVEHGVLADEVVNLRRALSSRSTIEQAKGMIMAQQHCSADDAFEVLSKLSSDTNVKLADVALALVYQAQAAPEEAGP